MAQNILTVPLEEFTCKIKTIDSRGLLNLLRGLYEFKWERGKNFSNDQIMDIERKETRINKELKRRNYINKYNRGEFNDFVKQINFKKRNF